MNTCVMIAVTSNYIPLAQMWYHSFKQHSGISAPIICFVDSEDTQGLVQARLPELDVRVLDAPYTDNYTQWEDNYFYGMRMKVFGLYALQGSYDRCLYFDVDTLVLKDIQELIQLDLAGNTLAGVPDCQQHRHLNIPCDSGLETEMAFRIEIAGGMDKYINAGVMLIDLNLLPPNTFEDYVAQEKPYCSDQDYLNEVCSGNVMQLPDTFNYMINYWLNTPSEELTRVTHTEMGNAHIQHFHGILKPWSKTHNPRDWWLKLQYHLEYFEEVLAACRDSFGSEASSFVAYVDAEETMRTNLQSFYTNPEYKVRVVMVGNYTQAPCGSSEFAQHLANEERHALVTNNPIYVCNGVLGVTLDVGTSKWIPPLVNISTVVIAESTEDITTYEACEVYPPFPLKSSYVASRLRANDSMLLDALEKLLPVDHPVRVYRDAVRSNVPLSITYDTRGK